MNRLLGQASEVSAISRAITTFLLCLLAGAGCVAPAATDAPGADGEAAAREAAWAVIEARPHEDVSFTVVSRAGGEIVVAGYAWWPEGPADTVVLAIHGSSGVPCWLFGPIAVPGYSLAHHATESGRAFVTFDLPGYGNTSSMQEGGGQSDSASVLRQIVEQLRAGAYEAAEPRAFPVVLGLGVSMGGSLVMLAQGAHAPFDGIVPVAWSHAPRPDAYRACVRGDGPCPEGWAFFWEIDQTDPRVLDDASNVTLSPNPTTVQAEFAAWRPCLGCRHAALEGIDALAAPEDAAAALIDVPVLMVLGANDFLVRATTQAEEEAVFRSATDLTVVTFERTGHTVFRHLNHADVFATILDWMGERGW